MKTDQKEKESSKNVTVLKTNPNNVQNGGRERKQSQTQNKHYTHKFRVAKMRR